MAIFELWPPRSDAKFSPAGPFPQGGTASQNLLTPQLRLKLQESETVALSGQPDSGKLIVKPDKAEFVKVERIHDPSQTSTIYRITGVAKGESVIEARSPAPRSGNGMPVLSVNGSLASLNVTILDNEPATSDSDFVAGFREGFSASAGKAGELILLKISKDPQAFGQAVQLGCARGLLEGVVSLAKSLWEILKLGVALSPAGLVVNTTRYVFDQTFRDEVDKHKAAAKKLADTMAALATEIALHRNQFSAIFKVNGKTIGRIVGEELGREMLAEITKKSAADIGDFIGFIIGRVMFEVIFILGTEGIGMAANAAKVTGEGAGLAARLIPKLRRLLGPLRELEAFVKARLGLKAGESIVPAATKLLEYINFAHDATTEERALGTFLDELAQTGKLGQEGRIRGMPRSNTSASPDYNFVPKGQDAANQAVPGQRWDAWIADGQNLNNIVSNAVTSKSGRQAEFVVIEVGTKGTSGQVADAAIREWKPTDLEPMTVALKRVIFVRNSGGARMIVHDIRVR